jgi:hypothetical protein
LQQYQQYKCLSGSSNSGKEREDSAEEDQQPQQQRRQPQQQESSPSPKLLESPKLREKLQQQLTPHDQPLLVSGGQGKSIGSVLHPDHCTPCSFFCYSLVGCNRGRECEYCHEDHPKKARRRGKKKRKANRSATDADTECGAAADLPPEAWDNVPPEEDSDEAPQEARQEDRGLSGTWSQYQDIDISTAPNADRLMRPTPTPDPLVPLLMALEFLAPLPTLTPAPTQAMLSLSHDTSAGYATTATTSKDSWHEEEYHIPDPNATTQTMAGNAQRQFGTNYAYSGKLTLWYHESTISLEVGDEKHIIPFLTCNAELQGKELEPLFFSVKPELPEGLQLDTASGVIKGICTRPMMTAGYSRHVVTAANSALSSSSAIDISVRPAGFWT